MDLYPAMLVLLLCESLAGLLTVFCGILHYS